MWNQREGIESKPREIQFILPQSRTNTDRLRIFLMFLRNMFFISYVCLFCDAIVTLQRLGIATPEPRTSLWNSSRRPPRFLGLAGRDFEIGELGGLFQFGGPSFLKFLNVQTFPLGRIGYSEEPRKVLFFSWSWSSLVFRGVRSVIPRPVCSLERQRARGRRVGSRNGSQLIAPSGSCQGENALASTRGDVRFT